MALDKKAIESRSVESINAVKNRHLLKTLRGGEIEMRKASTIYLPREKKENQEFYEYRKDYKTDLYTGTQKSIEDINNRIFSKQVNFECEDEEIKELITKNITGSGDSLNNFAKKYCLEGIWSGLNFAIITAKTAKTMDLTPSVKNVVADDVLDMRLNDENEIVLFRYQVITQEAIDLFSTAKVTYIYLYYKVSNVFKMKTYKKIEDEEYEELEEVILPSNFKSLPIVPYYPDSRNKGLDADRPYQNLANKNRTHWIYNSLYLDLISIASRPFLFSSGIKNIAKNPITFGVKTMYNTEQENADIKWIQADSKSTNMLHQFLEDLKEEMKMLGSEFLETKQVMTATQAVINTTDTSSKANSFAQNLEESLIKIVEFILVWKRKENTEFTLTCNKNVGITKDRESFDVINSLNDKNVISDKDLRMTAKNLGYLASDMTEEDYIENLEAEGKLINIDFVSKEEEEYKIIEEENEDE